MAWNDLTNPEAWKLALANLLRKGEDVGTYISEAPTKAGKAIIEGHKKNEELWAKAHANPQRPFQVTDQNAFNELNDRYMGGVLGFAPVGITAWHGSPHTFEKFDMSKVGTGEGAQAYGHGMYFAESPSVANTYKGSDEVRILANGQVTESPVAKQIIRYGGNPQAFIDSMQNKANLQKQALQKASKEEVLPGLSDYDIAKLDLDSTLKKIEEAKSYKSVKTEPVGNLYKVDIPDEHIPTMMDWDKPLGQQSAFVKKAINNLKKQVTPEMKMELGDDLNLLFGKDITPSQFLNTWEIIHPTGGTGIGEKLLNEQGVKGIRYLDNPSRDAGKGTSNFVVFDPTDVKILERNNQPMTRKEVIEEQVNKLK